VLLAFMEVVESAGTSFAFPTQTVHLEVEREALQASATGTPARDGTLAAR
jgi:hypothetical protein